jgi:hypothetical protein
MTSAEPHARRLFTPEPSGPPRSEKRIGALAQHGGVLVGCITYEAALTWLANPDGELTRLIWPADFRIRFDPLEVLDEQGEVIARGGQLTLAGGSFIIKTDDPRSAGQKAFAARGASLPRDD